MDGINNNYSQFAANLTSKLGQVQTPVVIQDVVQEENVSSNSQVRILQSDNKVAYVQSHPDLAESANLTSEERSDLLQSTSEKTLSAEITCRGNTVLFDLYAVLALIQETSQEMRNAERDLRKAEVASIVSSIQTQAELQRSAAVTQLITGCITAGISITMLAVSAAGMAKSLSSTKATQNAAGLDQMRQQQQLTLAEGNPAQTELNLEVTRQNTPTEIQTEVNAKMAKAGAEQPLASEVKSEAKVQSCANELKTATQELDQAKGDVTKIKAEIKALQDNAQGPNSTQKAKVEMFEKLPGKQAELAAAEKNVTSKQDIVNQKQEALEAAMDESLDPLQSECNARDANLKGVVNEYQEQFDMKTTKAKQELLETGKVSDDTKKEVEAAGKKLNYARAYQLNKSAHLPQKPQTSQSSFAQVHHRVHEIESMSATPEAQNLQIKAQMIGQSATMVSQLGSSVGQGIAGIFTAESTAEQAEQKQAEENLDQVKDLFSNTQQVIQQAIQIFSSVVSKESQSIEEIIGGIRA